MVALSIQPPFRRKYLLHAVLGSVLLHLLVLSFWIAFNNGGSNISHEPTVEIAFGSTTFPTDKTTPQEPIESQVPVSTVTQPNEIENFNREATVYPEPVEPTKPTANAEMTATAAIRANSAFDRVAISAFLQSNSPRSAQAPERSNANNMYIAAWTRNVRKIGQLNYPIEAATKGIRGDLVMRIVINSDGTLEEAKVLTTSGQDLLDEAAIRVVQLAAPFPPLPLNVQKVQGQLTFTQSWSFQRGRLFNN